MKQRSDLDADVPCPICGKRFSLGGPLDFQWGKIPHSYQIGDRVVWLKNRAGEVVPPFQFVGPDDLWNCGEPTYADLYVFDSNPNISEFTCTHCGTLFEGIAAQIGGGTLRGAVAFLPGEVQRRFGATLDTFDIAVARADGTYEPRPDWYDPPFSVYQGQWP